MYGYSNLVASLLQGEVIEFNSKLEAFCITKDNPKNTITKRYFGLPDIDKIVSEMESKIIECGIDIRNYNIHLLSFTLVLRL
jgi:hypothetical protein